MSTCVRSRSKSPKKKRTSQSSSPRKASPKKRGRPRLGAIRRRPTRPPKEPKSTRTSDSKSVKSRKPRAKKQSKDSDVDSDENDSEEERNFDLNSIPESTRVLRNQETIDHEKEIGERPKTHLGVPKIEPSKKPRDIKVNILQPQLEQNVNTYKIPFLPTPNLPEIPMTINPGYSIARLMLLTPFDYSQATFATQELVRMQIKLEQTKNILNFTWLLVKNFQLPYNLINPFIGKVDGMISLEEEYRSINQIDPFQDEPKKEGEEMVVDEIFPPLDQIDESYLDQDIYPYPPTSDMQPREDEFNLSGYKLTEDDDELDIFLDSD